jgi:secreted trypsin-like serine protease
MPCNCNKKKKQAEVKTKNNSNIKIVNGNTVNYKKYPFFGRLWITKADGSTALCGGALIKKGTESIVITAAHCVDVSTDKIQVGFYQPTRCKKKYIYDVTKITIYPGWDRNVFINDIALLYIAGTPPSEVPVLAIPDKILGAKFIIPGTKTKSIGYGEIEQGKKDACLLQCGCVPIVSRTNPENLWSAAVKSQESIIFAGQSFSNPSQNVNICTGDSGGPLLYVYNGVTYLVGLNSFVSTNGCSAYGYPGGYTNVNYLREWITINAGV